MRAGEFPAGLVRKSIARLGGMSRGRAVVNQWGRDGNFSSSGSRSPGGGGIVIAAIVALVLGAGGGYMGARFLGGASTSDLKARDERISDLEKQVSDLKFTTSGSANQEDVLRERIKELAKANETLKALVDENENQGNAEAEAEIAALKKTIEEAGDLRTELNRARRSQQVSELQIIELEDEIKKQRAEMEKLRKSLADAATQGDAGSKALSEQIKTLEASLAESRKQAAAASDLRKQMTLLKDDVAQKTAERDAARNAATSLQREIDKVKAELIQGKKDLAAAQAAVMDKDSESATLQKQLSLAEDMLAVRDSKIRELSNRAGALQRLLDEAKANLERLEAEHASFEEIRSDKAKLEAEVAALKQTIEALEASESKDAVQPDVSSGNDDEPTSARRDPVEVRRALDAMPGFGRLTAEKQAELTQKLEDGECVADALKATLGRVPAIALRNLIRDLGSKC
jgi:chromosome segregation ATPase